MHISQGKSTEQINPQNPDCLKGQQMELSTLNNNIKYFHSHSKLIIRITSMEFINKPAVWAEIDSAMISKRTLPLGTW